MPKESNKLLNAAIAYVFVIGILIFTPIFVPNLTNYMSITFNGIMVLVTGVYMIFTVLIFKEAQVSRNVSLIEKKLEKFYNPFNRVLGYELEINLFIGTNLWEHLTSKRIKSISARTAPHFQIRQIDNPTIALQDLVVYEHLATDEIQVDMNRLIALIQKEQIHPKINLDDLKNMVSNLEARVPEEIDKLKGDLNKHHSW